MRKLSLVNETLVPETETETFPHFSETETRPRRWENVSRPRRRDRDHIPVISFEVSHRIPPPGEPPKLTHRSPSALMVFFVLPTVARHWCLARRVGDINYLPVLCDVPQFRHSIVLLCRLGMVAAEGARPGVACTCASNIKELLVTYANMSRNSSTMSTALT